MVVGNSSSRQFESSVTRPTSQPMMHLRSMANGDSRIGQFERVAHEDARARGVDDSEGTALDGFQACLMRKFEHPVRALTFPNTAPRFTSTSSPPRILHFLQAFWEEPHLKHRGHAFCPVLTKYGSDPRTRSPEHLYSTTPFPAATPPSWHRPPRSACSRSTAVSPTIRPRASLRDRSRKMTCSSGKRSSKARRERLSRAVCSQPS